MCRLLVLLWVTVLFSAPLAYAQQPALGPSAASYQYMHIAYSAGEIRFLPAYNGKESVKIAELKEAGTDKWRAPLEVMSKVLTDASADGWDVVSVVPVTTAGGSVGSVYVMRKRKQ